MLKSRLNSGVEGKGSWEAGQPEIVAGQQFPALNENQLFSRLPSYLIYLTCYPWDPESVQLEEVLEVRRAEPPGQGQRGKDPLSWKGVTMGFLLFQVQGQGPLWCFLLI